MESTFKFYSLGMVSKDLLEDDNYIEAYPIEHLPTTSGELNEITKKTASTTDASGKSKSTSVTRSSLIRAKWLPYGQSNRATAPYVCKGETVMLFQYGGVDKFFWMPMYNENELRKREKVTYLWSDKEKQGTNDKNYYLTIDTINKFIRFHTGVDDGEFTTYDIDIDTKEGILTIQDGLENEITMSSKDDQVTIKTNKVIEFYTVQQRTINTDTIHKITNDQKTDIARDCNETVGRNKQDDIKEKYTINLKKLVISNGEDELINILKDLTQALLTHTHTGNMGSPTPIAGGAADFAIALKKLKKFIP